MDTRLYFMLAKAENAMTVYIKKQLSLAGLNVSPGQLGILFLLKDRNGQTMSELSAALETDNSAVTRAVDRLEKSGLAARQMNLNDRREYHIVITEQGINETVKAIPVIAAVNALIDSEFTKDEVDIFRSVITRMNCMFNTFRK
ncbi:MAG TPA: MarR family transcriptional regulator [Spirochaetota bacterium]|nr:MarR family transcriptional regulator [Spirochaetota bacterium]